MSNQTPRTDSLWANVCDVNPPTRTTLLLDLARQLETELIAKCKWADTMEAKLNETEDTLAKAVRLCDAQEKEIEQLEQDVRDLERQL